MDLRNTLIINEDGPHNENVQNDNISENVHGNEEVTGLLNTLSQEYINIIGNRYSIFLLFFLY